MRFQFIAKHLRDFGVTRLCSALDVSRSGFYAWRDRPTSARAREDGRLRVLIRGLHKKSRSTYGVPRMQKDLRELGEHVSRKRIARLMAEDGLEGRSPRRSRRRSTTKAPPDVVGENVLNRQFHVDDPNRVWVADTTYLDTEDGPAFLVAILDLFSRRVVGWAVGAHLDTELARRALAKALALRQPSPRPGSCFTAIVEVNS